MNTFRFRGKRVNNNEWVEGDIVTKEGVTQFINTHNSHIKFLVIPSTVGLISSMLDSTGKLISQGDVVMIDGLARQYKVEFDGLKFTLKFNMSFDLCDFTSSDLTIVGTIHD